jgi:hypothetical protein
MTISGSSHLAELGYGVVVKRLGALAVIKGKE